MERKTKQRIAGAALVVSCGLFLSSAYNQSQLSDDRWEQEFKNHPAYVETMQLNKAWDSLQCSLGELSFMPILTDYNEVIQPEPPNGIRARQCLDNALAAMGDRDNLDDRIRNVRDSLPEQEKILEYNGVPVEYNTFRWQLNEVIKVSYSLYNLEEESWKKVEQARNTAKIGWRIGVGIGFLGIMGALFGLNRYKKGTQNENIQPTGKDKSL